MRIPTLLSFVVLLCTLTTTGVVAQPQEKEPPPVPKVEDKTWPKNPIDFFVLAQIEARKLKPSQETSGHALARRASLALTGLPPSLDQLNRFLDDKTPIAYEAMIDRLLKSRVHQDYWAIITTHHKKPADLKNLAQAESWATILWEQVFGQKLKPDSHPQLRNYLATLVQRNDDARILRLLLTSATYRQSSEITQELKQLDPSNEWLARYPKTKLPRWVINRSILFLSGLSNEDENLVPDRELKPEPREKTQPPQFLPRLLCSLGRNGPGRLPRPSPIKS